jgi:hypothetical protein
MKHWDVEEAHTQKRHSVHKHANLAKFLFITPQHVRQKGVHYMSVKIFNSLPKFLVDLREDETMFVERLKEIFIHNAFYSVDEFSNYCQKNINNTMFVSIFKQILHYIV